MTAANLAWDAILSAWLRVVRFAARSTLHRYGYVAFHIRCLLLERFRLERFRLERFRLERQRQRQRSGSGSAAAAAAQLSDKRETSKAVSVSPRRC
jgi:hypothetical protein